MRLNFRLATFELRPSVQELPANLRDFFAGNKTLVVERLWSGPHSMVLVSASPEDDLRGPVELRCWLAFSNRVEWCDLLRRAGFPVVEAAIDGAEHRVEVTTARYPVPEGAAPSVLEDGALFGLDWGSADLAEPDYWPAPTTYRTLSLTPDAGQPDECVQATAVRWDGLRQDLTRLAAEQTFLRVEPARLPQLALLGPEPLPATAAWDGLLEVPPGLLHADVPVAGDRDVGTLRVPREEVLGPADFLFEDVEIIGFRLDLQGHSSAVRDSLFDAIESTLNCVNTGLRDFSYRVATRRVVIELLRYPKMRLARSFLALGEDDYQCQHELLVRVLVGRVDDDSAQARAPALHVPAIFVDNPWSKALGRDVQGFDKRMSTFCVDDGGGHAVALRMDGRMAAGAPIRPLMDVGAIHLVREVGTRPAEDTRLLGIEYGSDVDRSDDEFESVDLSVLAGGALLSRSAWRQADFNDAEFRRSFAAPVLRQGFTGHRSIQVAPVDGRPGMPTWIEGTLSMAKVRFQFPADFATLTLRQPEGAPAAWLRLCEAIDSAEGKLTLPAGQWYRARADIRLTIDDGLAW